jgi:hypothetical protein
VATVEGDSLAGILTAQSIGSTTITAVSAEGGFTAQCALQVKAVGDFDEPQIYLVGPWGLFVNGKHVDNTYNGYTLNGVAADDQGVHIAGCPEGFFMSARAMYFRNGVPTYLPASTAEWSNATNIDVDSDGNVRVSGYHRPQGQQARLWLIAPGYEPRARELEGVDVIAGGELYSYGGAVHVFNGDPYMVGSVQDSTGIRYPVIWRHEQKHTILGHNDVELADIGVGTDGTIHVIDRNNRMFAVSQDMTSMTQVALDPPDAAVDCLFVDGNDVHAAGWSGDYGYYWKNGRPLQLEAPQYANWVQGVKIFVRDGHVYIAALSYTSTNVWLVPLYIDGLLIRDDREARINTTPTRPSGLYVK